MYTLLSIGKRFVVCVLYLAILDMTGGCSYYKSRGYYHLDNSHIAEKAQMPNRYIIVHRGDKAWHLTNIVINEEKTDMTGRLEELPAYHRSYLHREQLDKAGREGATLRYRPARTKPTHEVHIYLAEGTAIGNREQASIPLSGVRRIDVYDLAVGSTIASYVFTTIGIIAGVVVIIGIIALATKSSCPFLYVRDGDTWQFTGEMYGGAIAAPMERDDYMPLPALQGNDGGYELKIANELKEKQYTNLAELLVIDRADQSTVLADKDGNLYSISHPVAPRAAVAGSNDCVYTLSAKDTSACLFDEPDAADPAFSNLVMSFPKPAGAKTGKLVINAKNSYWLDYMFGRFTEQFGTRYNQFAAQQKKTPPAESRQWSLEQGIPLSVKVQTDRGWEPAGHFDVVGPLASRDMIMQLDLSHVSGTDVKIRLQCGARFWEVDYAAMDFTENTPLSVHRLKPFSAVDEKGHELSGALAATDSQYLEQPEIGSATVVRYTVPPQAKGTTRSVILHSRGYYEYIRNYTNKPNLSRLLTFKKPGAFTRFAAIEYRRLTMQKDLLAFALNT